MMKTITDKKNKAVNCTWSKFVLGLGVFTAMLSGHAFAGFSVNNGLLLDSYGNPFIMRGVNHAHTWYEHETPQALQDIAGVGANAVRIVLSNGEQTEGWGKDSEASVGQIITQMKTLNMISVLEVHDVTGYPEKVGSAPLSTAVDYWIEIQDVLMGQEDYVIINIGNEPFGNTVTDQVWVDEHITAIQRLRDAGFTHTLMVDAANWGQDWQEIMLTRAPEVFAADPLANVVFSVHMYDIYNNRSIIDNYLDTFVNDHQLPLVVGEFGADHIGADVDEVSILELTDQYNIGYLGWSWSGNSGGTESLDITIGYDVNNLSPWGDFLLNSAYGIGNTSQIASVFTGGVGGVFPPKAIPLSATALQDTATDITLSGTDLDGTIVGYSITSQPNHGSLTIVGPNVEYTPDSGYTGSDSFSYTVTDNSGAISNPQMVSIAVVSAGGVGNTAACEVNYDVHNDWGAGAHINVYIKNNQSVDISGYSLSFTLGANESYLSSWNIGSVTNTMNTVIVSSLASYWNGTIPANGGEIVFGLQINKGNGAPIKPSLFSLNNLTCMAVP
ncbi:glycoside hydrolase family 5 [Marinomonas agarivorans]|nr:glycoside hydrolase family 5 [Marinomonas agarivorans]